MHPYRTAPPILPPPPRRIPWTVVAQLRFGGVFGSVGWALFVFGLLMSSIFLGQSEAVTLRWFRGPVAREAGEVTASEATNMKENNARVFAVDATYEHAGRRRFVRSYTTSAPPEVGTPVTVEIDLADTSRARIAGLRTRPFGSFAAFVVIFPLVGLAFAAAQLWRSRRPLDLLRRGLVARGTFVEKHPTRTRVNRRTVYRMVFSYEDDKERRFRVEARTHTPEILEDEAHEQVLYDPIRPGSATLVDHLPGSPRVDEQGRIAPGDPFKALVAAALPVVAALATAVAVLAM